jgi:hypothetical protein
VPSHDIPREILQFLRDYFSITASARFIRCSLNIKLVTFRSGQVFWVFFNNDNHLFFSSLPLVISRSHAPYGHGLLIFCLRVYSCTPFSSLGRFWTCLVPSVRTNLGQYGLVGKLHSMVLWVDGLLSSHLDSPCFHSWD